MIGRRSSLGCLHCKSVSIHDASRTAAMDFPESDSSLHAREQRVDAQESSWPKSVEPSPYAPIAYQSQSGDAASPPQVVATAAPTKPTERWWTSIAVIGVSLLFFLLASVVMMVVATVYVHGIFSIRLLSNPDHLREVTQSPVALFLLIVAPQIALVTPCLIAAYLSPQPMSRRLALVRGNWPVWAWLAAALATPLIGLVSGLVISFFIEESDALREMSEIFRHQGKTGFTAQLILMVALTPALCEELLFRGYVQSRLTRAFPPVMGILFSSLAFAAFHMDPVHIIAVVPLGLFLGWLTWQSGSLFPAMLAHFGNNLVSVLATIIAPTPDSSTLSLPALEFTLAILLLGCIGIVATSVASIVYRRPVKTSTDPHTHPV